MPVSDGTTQTALNLLVLTRLDINSLEDNVVYWTFHGLKYEKKNSNESPIGSWGREIAFPELTFFSGWHLKENWLKT